MKSIALFSTVLLPVLFLGAFLVFYPENIFAATSSDSVRIQLLVDNGTSSSTSTPPVPPVEPAPPAPVTGNGQPLGPISPSEGASLRAPVPPQNLPENVADLRLIPTKNTLTLQWKNPATIDFSEIRVVRSPFGFPKDPLDGKVVYEGSGQSIQDASLPASNEIYFYTVFVKRKDGTYSSGAVAMYHREGNGGASVGIPEEKRSQFVDAVPEISLLTPTDFTVTTYEPDRENVVREKRLLQENGKIFLRGGERITLSVEYKKFPEVLKTIVVYITPSVSSPVIISRAGGPDKNMQSFLLAVNDRSTDYEATFSAPSEDGRYDVTVKILDYRTDLLRNISAKNAFEVKKAPGKFRMVLENVKSQFSRAEKSLLLAIFVVLILLALALRRIVMFS